MVVLYNTNIFYFTLCLKRAVESFTHLEEKCFSIATSTLSSQKMYYKKGSVAFKINNHAYFTLFHEVDF